MEVAAETRHEMRLTPEDKAKIVELYTNNKLSLSEIAPKFDKSRAAIWSVLKAAGVDTSKAVACWVEVECSWCHKTFKRKRKQARNHLRHFCCGLHYLDFMRTNGADYNGNRHAQRKSRVVVEFFYGPLPDGSVVHHRDKNTENLNPKNLMLFASHSDHMRWHRGDRIFVEALWDGLKLSDEELSFYLERFAA